MPAAAPIKQPAPIRSTLSQISARHNTWPS